MFYQDKIRGTYTKLSRHYCLKQLYEDRGVNLSKKMEPLSFVNSILSSPIIVSMFPQLQTAASTINTLLTTYNNVKQAIEDAKTELDDAISTLESMEKAVDDARSAYDKALQAPGAYDGKGTGEVVVTSTPVLQAAYNVIEEAQEKLKKQRDTVIPKIEEKIAALEKQADDLMKDMTEQINSYVSDLISAEVERDA